MKRAIQGSRMRLAALDRGYLRWSTDALSSGDGGWLLIGENNPLWSDVQPLGVDLAQDDADALLAFHLTETPPPLEVPQDADGATLPVSHPVHQLVRAATWLAAQLPLAA